MLPSASPRDRDATADMQAADTSATRPSSTLCWTPGSRAAERLRDLVLSTALTDDDSRIESAPAAAAKAAAAAQPAV